MTKKDKILPSGSAVRDELISPRLIFEESHFKSLLQQLDLKITSQRLAVLKALNSGAKTHLTAREIFEKVLKTHPDIGFATVYRFIKTITELGVLSKLKMNNASARYEFKTDDHHHHIICVHCGKIVEFQNDKMENLIQNITQKNKFSLQHHIIEIYGECGRKTCKQ